MPKPVRGRFSIVCAMPGGGSWKCETVPTRNLTAAELVEQLREYADFIERHFVPKPESEERT